MKKARIGVLTGGGDCAGLNPALKWVVTAATDETYQQNIGPKYEVLGIRDGWQGLVNLDLGNPGVDEYIIPLNQEFVRTWDRDGGSNLGTSRTNPYDPLNNQSKTVIRNIEKLGLDALIAIGGDDTLGVAAKLSKAGVNVIGIPKTIDRDLGRTDYTLGFETALNVITESVDRLRTIAGSHKRVFVVETMGRQAGWLALEAGESCGAHIILIPEHDFSVEKVKRLLMERKKAGARYEIILVAEGAKPKGSKEFTKEKIVDSFGNKTLGGIGEFLASEITNFGDFECRNMVLGHLQRGGAPCSYDRRMGRYFGIAAVNMVMNRDFGKMVSFSNGRITTALLEDAVRTPNFVDVETQYDTDTYNGRRKFLSTDPREKECTEIPHYLKMT